MRMDTQGAAPPQGTEGRGEKPHPLAAVVKEAGLSQKEFAELGGWLPSTVNRWLRQRGTDGRRVPRHVWALALAYKALGRRQREALRAELAALGRSEGEGTLEDLVMGHGDRPGQGDCP